MMQLNSYSKSSLVAVQKCKGHWSCYTDDEEVLISFLFILFIFRFSVIQWVLSPTHRLPFAKADPSVFILMNWNHFGLWSSQTSLTTWCLAAKELFFIILSKLQRGCVKNTPLVQIGQDTQPLVATQFIQHQTPVLIPACGGSTQIHIIFPVVLAKPDDLGLTTRHLPVSSSPRPGSRRESRFPFSKCGGAALT